MSKRNLVPDVDSRWAWPRPSGVELGMLEDGWNRTSPPVRQEGSFTAVPASLTRARDLLVARKGDLPSVVGSAPAATRTPMRCARTALPAPARSNTVTANTTPKGRDMSHHHYGTKTAILARARDAIVSQQGRPVLRFPRLHPSPLLMRLLRRPSSTK